MFDVETLPHQRAPTHIDVPVPPATRNCRATTRRQLRYRLKLYGGSNLDSEVSKVERDLQLYSCTVQLYIHVLTAV